MSDDYDWKDDFRRSIDFAYEHIRERVARGGRGWNGYGHGGRTVSKWPGRRLSSYAPCAGCGAHCDEAARSTATEPCWGRVLFSGELGEKHTCFGHESADYKPVFGVK
jgi:hypothetical protein